MTRLRRLSRASVVAGADRDSALFDFVESIASAARSKYGDELITAPGLHFHPAKLYAETHFALTALLLGLLRPADFPWLDLAEDRLRLWDGNRGPATFFNAMAVCLAAIVFRRSGTKHSGLESILGTILERTRPHRHVAYDQWCGNNCYLQQVAVDLVLLPLARGETLRPEDLSTAANEFGRYRTAEGFFYDLPREGIDAELLCPPTYIMKMLFLLGICDECHESAAFADLFSSGIEATLPLLSLDGEFSYFGRTDNSPFATGLTIFNLRKAACTKSELADEFESAAARAERHYLSFPRTHDGLLECNRFRDAGSEAESAFSRDSYAKVGEYSVASSAYALLACYFFRHPGRSSTEAGLPERQIAESRDLGVVRFAGPGRELILRTRSDLTSWDRRYMGPTILRYRADGELLVGAISKTVTSDSLFADAEDASRIGEVIGTLKRWYLDGFEQLDAMTVGFMPVVRDRAVDYLPHEILGIEYTPSGVKIEYRMAGLGVRGLYCCAVELRERLKRRLPWIRSKAYGRPPTRPSHSIKCSRTISFTSTECRIEDIISGDLSGKRIMVSTRSFPNASVQVSGLGKERSITGWGSDGRQAIDIYGGETSGTQIGYQCTIGLNTRIRSA